LSDHRQFGNLAKFLLGGPGPSIERITCSFDKKRADYSVDQAAATMPDWGFFGVFHSHFNIFLALPVLGANVAFDG
jgi:hypothetical protein